jgi:hypothetical protein
MGFLRFQRQFLAVDVFEKNEIVKKTKFNRVKMI